MQPSSEKQGNVSVDCRGILLSYLTKIQCCRCWPHNSAFAQEEPLILVFPAMSCSQFRHSEAVFWENKMTACTSDIMFFDNKFHASFAMKQLGFKSVLPR